MPTTNQYLKGVRKKKRVYKKTILEGCPQKKGACLRVFIKKPKKPNSAQRKVARVALSNMKEVTAYIPGQGGDELQRYSSVLIRGGRVPDLPGVNYKVVRGKYDCGSIEIFRRTSARSKYGLASFKYKKSFFKKYGR